MRKDQQWGGLITHASPYLLPRGANREQVNLHCQTPGELQCRKGLTRLSGFLSTGTVLDAWSIHGTQSTRLLSLTQDGRLIVADGLAAIRPPVPATVPDLRSRVGTTDVSYLWQYSADGGAVSNLVLTFYGGSASQSSWSYEISGNSSDCSGGITEVQAGRAAITDVDGILESELCPHDGD